MEINRKTFQTPKGLVEGVQTKWPGFNILIVTGSKRISGLSVNSFPLRGYSSVG